MKRLKINVAKKDVHGKVTKEEHFIVVGEEVHLSHDIKFNTPEALLQVGAKVKFGIVVEAEVVEVEEEKPNVDTAPKV